MRASFLALALAACWESGTEAPPIPAIVSPLEDAGGRFRPDNDPPEAALLHPPPTLVRSGRVVVSTPLTHLDIEGATGKKLTPDGTLIVVLVDIEAPDSVKLGRAAFRFDGASRRSTVSASVWSRRIAKGDSQSISVSWDGHTPRGLLVWMEWLGLSTTRGALEYAGATDDAIRTASVDDMPKGTVVVAVAAARPTAGVPDPPFEYVGGAALHEFGGAVGYVIADGTTTYRATFATDARATTFTTLITSYPALDP